MSTVRERGLPSSIMTPTRPPSCPRGARRSVAVVGCRSARLVLALPVAVLVGVSACAGGDDATTTSQAVAEALAPSQIAASTVPPPTLPDLCDPDEVGVEIVEPDGGIGQPDQIIDLVNEGDRECDVDISATGGAAAEMEPSVRLAPEGIGHVWVEGQDDCDETLADPEVEVWLDINGDDRPVDLIFVSPCGVELVAFFTD
jgi:hypothetical protein